jgi:hypothetical protein
MGGGDAVLEVPWAAPEAGLRYYNLREQPELLDQLEEGRRFPELAEFLRHLNAAGGTFETVKCDAWATTEIESTEEIVSASHKHASYCDIIFRDPLARESFPQHEALVRKLVELLAKAPEIPAAVEFVVRRCIFHDEVTEGCAITCFVSGYGNDQTQARRQWGIALKLVENAFRQRPESTRRV